MSMLAAGCVDWRTPLRRRKGMQALWDAAAARPGDGIGVRDVTRILPWYGIDGALATLGEALAWRHLFEVTRMEIDETGRESSGARYFAVGVRP